MRMLAIKKKHDPRQRYLNLIGLILGWFAVVGQFILIIQNREAGIAETVLRFFSFFTILTNILVALYFTAPFIKLRPTFFNLLQKDSSLPPITAFILIVGLVYQVVLRAIWHPTGIQLIIDELLHSLIPLFVLGYWYFRLKTAPFDTRVRLRWMLYPMGYLGFILVRGAYSGYYPYPFLNVSSLGYAKVWINSALICLVMLAVLYSLALIGKKINRSHFTP